MIQPRRLYSKVELEDGSLLFIGGICAKTQKVLKSIEKFDIRTNKFSVIGNMKRARFGHKATILNDKEILITDGSSLITHPKIGVLEKAELIDIILLKESKNE